ncbi:MAG: AsmA family protein [Gammaproteobacteria bacterium]|nr:AsmA family protein [Gammaproteobacteria bacterium]
MGRFVKYFFWAAGGLLVVFVLAATALYLFFDPNDFREDISAAVKNQTGRELQIEGDIELDLFPWLAVEVGQVSLGNAPGFGDEPMLSLESARLSVRLLPILLRQHIEVGSADVNALRLNLQTSDSGNNWDDLLAGGSESSDAGGSESSGGLNVGGINIIDAAVQVTDTKSGATSVFDAVNLQVGQLSDDGSPVPVDGSLSFDIQPDGIKGDVSLDTVIAFDVESGKFLIDGLSLEGVIEGIAAIPSSVSVTTAGLEVSTRENMLAMQPAQISAFGIDVHADVEPFSYDGSITPKAVVQIDSFSPRSLMTLFDVEPPQTADEAVLSQVSLQAAVQFTSAAVDMTEVVMRLDDTTFKGSLSVPRSSSGAYQFDLSGDRIELARYMAPADESASGGAADAEAVEIPADLIRPLNARGKLQIAEATLGNIEFDDIQLGLNARNGRLRLFPASASLFGGRYTGDVQVDVSGSTPALSVDEKITGVDLGKLATAMFEQQNVTGEIKGSFRLSGRGADTAALQRSLSGSMDFELTDGTFEGTDVWYELRRARALLKGEPPPAAELPAKTDFSTVRATGVVSGGVMRNDDFYAELPFMRLTGRGSVDLAAASVDYGLTARILERPEFLPDATPEELEEFTEAVIPVKITGPLASPKLAPDVEELLKQRVEEEVKDLLEDKLKDLFGR